MHEDNPFNEHDDQWPPEQEADSLEIKGREWESAFTAFMASLPKRHEAEPLDVNNLRIYTFQNHVDHEDGAYEEGLAVYSGDTLLAVGFYNGYANCFRALVQNGRVTCLQQYTGEEFGRRPLNLYREEHWRDCETLSSEFHSGATLVARINEGLDGIAFLDGSDSLALAIAYGFCQAEK